MTSLSTWQLQPSSGHAPPKTNAPLAPPADVAAAAEADARHRAHCPMCVPAGQEPGSAGQFVQALFDAHAPWLSVSPASQRPGRPRPAQLLSKRGEPS